MWIILGVVTWQFFSRGLNESVNCLTGNKNMIRQIYFPREVFAVSKVLAQLIVTCMSLFVAVPFLMYLDISLTSQIIYVPIALLLVTLQVLGVGWLFAVPNVHHGDIAHMTRFITRAGFFVSPVMWTAEMAMERGAWGEAALWNPMVVPITMVRHGLEGKAVALPEDIILVSIGVSIALYVIGTMVFSRYERGAVKYL